jgi:ATP-binding cassette subfamily A (ABC1) protein 3
MISIGIALIPCVMISFILKEREDSLKHIQLISGMSLPAYWISNMLADLIKVYIPIILMVLISKIFSVNYKDVWVLFLLLPLALVPFTYITSFLFKNDTTAQIITLFLNFFVCAVMGVVVFFLQLVPTTQKLGIFLRWIFCILPNYCLINGILWSSSGSLIRATEPSYSANNWAWSNLGGDAAILVAHFVIDTMILIFIEADLLNCL